MSMKNLIAILVGISLLMVGCSSSRHVVLTVKDRKTNEPISGVYVSADEFYYGGAAIYKEDFIYTFPPLTLLFLPMQKEEVYPDPKSGYTNEVGQLEFVLHKKEPIYLKVHHEGYFDRAVDFEVDEMKDGRVEVKIYPLPDDFD